jgi:transposase
MALAFKAAGHVRPGLEGLQLVTGEGVIILARFMIALPAEMKVRLARVHERLRLVEDQISTLVKEKMQRPKEENPKMAQVAQLLRLPGIGPVSSWTFVMEFFG